MVERILNGLRNQGPGAIPALILSLLALGGTAYWLLSRDDSGVEQQTSEVVSVPAPLAPSTTPGESAPATPPAPGSGSGLGGASDRQGSADNGGDHGNSSSPAAPVAPAPAESDGGSDDATPSDNAGSSNGGGSGGDQPPSLEDIQQLLQNPPNRNADRHQDSSGGLPGLENLLRDGQGASSGGGGDPPTSLQDLVDQLNDHK